VVCARSELSPEQETDSQVQVSVCTRKNAKARSRVAGALGIKTKNIKDRVDSANGPIEREMRMYKPRDSSNEDADLINVTVKLRLNYISSSQQTDQTLSPSAASPQRSATIKLSHGPSISQAPVEVLDDAQEAAATHEAAEQEQEQQQQQQQQQQHSPQPATPPSPPKRESPAKQEAPAAAGSEPQLPNAATPADESDTCGQEETKGGGSVKALLSVVATAIAGGVTAYFASSARESTVQSSGEQAKRREQQPEKKGRAWRL
jgi:uncharacterized membrane protein YkoI